MWPSLNIQDKPILQCLLDMARVFLVQKQNANLMYGDDSIYFPCTYAGRWKVPSEEAFDVATMTRSNEETYTCLMMSDTNKAAHAAMNNNEEHPTLAQKDHDESEDEDDGQELQLFFTPIIGLSSLKAHPIVQAFAFDARNTVHIIFKHEKSNIEK